MTIAQTPQSHNGVAHNAPAPIDPNTAQRAASDPAASVWVNASAGTGKTKVLTDRLIRLMLPRAAAPDRPAHDGTPPHRILCLTYTKAGAGEMLNRIMETLSEWAAMDEEKLTAALEKKVLGHPPSPAQLAKARALFAEVVDTPGGIKIMTIHSFCQSVLGRFPVEAQLPPDFTLLSEDEAHDAIRKARDSVLHHVMHGEDERLNALMNMLTKTQNSEQIIGLLNQMIRQRQKISRAIQNHQGLPNLLRAIYEAHNLPPFAEDAAINDRALGRINISDIYDLQAWLNAHGKNDQKRAALLQEFLQIKERGGDMGAAIDLLYQAAIVKSTGAPYTPTKPALADRPDLEDRLLTLATIMQDWHAQQKALATCQKSEIVLTLAADVIDRYHAEKLRSHKLDYDDLILKTVDLVRDAPQWVMYKLDGGIDHILVDEAQDSNPDQWIIIDALIQEFFAGEGQEEDVIRTLFVVGDEKQSIFGFQGSDPDVFQTYRRRFAADFKSAALIWRDQPLNTSFRSVQAVLDIVDHCFASADKRVALTGTDTANIKHDAFRAGQAGHIELWPLIKAEKEDAAAAWTRPNPEDSAAKPHPQAQLAQKIATEIKGWIARKEPLEATGQPLRPGDIMILVRNRNAFVDYMIRALKDAQIPVSGVDRMVLSNQIAIQDLMALARFSLMPDDDLSLAAALKSPLIGLDEDALFALAHGRDGRLWPALKNAANSSDRNPYIAIVAWLNALIKNIRQQGVHEFFSRLLIAPCPASSSAPHGQSALGSFIARLGEDALDPIEEFLSRCFDFDLQHRSDVQHFLHLFEQTQESIKREIDEGQNVVRIMTVHGSKGLQAPVVFLPDTIITPREKNKADKFIWAAAQPNMGDDPSHTALTDDGLPLWVNTKDDASDLYLQAQEDLHARNAREYERLLYVALTRAEDRLYICGCLPTAGTTPAPHSWYLTVKQAMAAHPDVQSIPEETADNAADNNKNNKDAGDNDNDDAVTLLYKTQQKADPKDRAVKDLLSVDLIGSGARDSILPAAFLHPPRGEPHNPPRPLQPSRPSEDDEVPALSPLKASGENKRFRRGNLIHALLQFLPELPADLRREKADEFARRNLPALGDQARRDMIDEVFAILDHHEYAPLFGAGSKAEAPITGMVLDKDGEHQVISGQIDRLLVDQENKTVMVVDYKTNRPAPRDAADIPILYRKQMQAYRVLLSQIYEGYEIKTYLLWTDYTAMMEVAPLL